MPLASADGGALHPGAAAAANVHMRLAVQAMPGSPTRRFSVGKKKPSARATVAGKPPHHQGTIPHHSAGYPYNMHQQHQHPGRPQPTFGGDYGGNVSAANIAAAAYYTQEAMIASHAARVQQLPGHRVLPMGMGGVHPMGLHHMMPSNMPMGYGSMAAQAQAAAHAAYTQQAQAQAQADQAQADADADADAAAHAAQVAAATAAAENRLLRLAAAEAQAHAAAAAAATAASRAAAKQTKADAAVRVSPAPPRPNALPPHPPHPREKAPAPPADDVSRDTEDELQMETEALLDADEQVERLDEKTEAAMRLQLDKFLKDLHRCNSETEGMGACERKKIRNRKASRVSRLKKKLNVYDLQRNYNAAQISLHSQQCMIADLKASLRDCAAQLLKTTPGYTCSKFNLRQLVSADRIIPRGMEAAAAHGSSMHDSPSEVSKKKVPSSKRAGTKPVHAMVYKQERTERTSPPASDAIDNTIDVNSDGDESFHSGSESAEEVDAKDKGAGALLALAAMAGRQE